MTKESKHRTKMTEHEVEAFITQYAKKNNMKGKALEERLRHTAATRLAALERYKPKAKAKAQAKAPKAKAPKAKAKAPKAKTKRAESAKAA